MRAASDSPVKTGCAEHTSTSIGNDFKESPVVDRTIRNDASINTADAINGDRGVWLEILLRALSAWPC